MIDKDMLEAIGQLMDEKLTPIRKDVDSLKTDVGSLKTDVDGLKDDVALLRSEYKKDQWLRLKVQQDTDVTKDTVKIIKEDVRDVKRQVGILYDWVDGLDLKVRDISEYKKTN